MSTIDTMDILITGVVAGIAGTLTMDILNSAFSRPGFLAKIDVRLIGRMVAGWMRGQFRYNDPGEMKPVANEIFIGYLAHYGIGVGLAVPFLLGWSLGFGEITPPLWVFVYGVATTAASCFVVYPSMGQGLCGMKSENAKKNFISSLANHIFFALGMTVVVLLM